MNVHTRHQAVEPTPLRRDDHPDPEDAELAELLRRVRPRRPLHELAVHRIRRGLEDRARTTSTRRGQWIRAVLAIAASLFLLETFAALAVSAWPASRRALLRTFQNTPRALPNPGPISHPIELAGPTESSPMFDESPSLPASAPSERITPAVASIPVRAHRTPEKQPPMRPASNVAAAERTIDDAEVAAYLGALAELNARKDPAKALKMLEAYRSQYPAGLFRDEVTVAEVRANVGLGHEREALALLDDLQTRAFAGLPQAGELSLLRIELLGRTDRCAEALTLLVPDLQSSLTSTQRERLLVERCACDAELGNLESSQQDLRDYLRQFPHGRFETELRQRISRAEPASE